MELFWLKLTKGLLFIGCFTFKSKVKILFKEIWSLRKQDKVGVLFG
jgi:hypothetical protein